MATGDLANLASVKAWLQSGGTTMGTTDDVMLNALISAASAFIRKEIVRDVVIRTYTAQPYNGTGGQRLTLRHAPIWNVSKVLIGGVSLPRSLDGIVSGYMWRAYGEIQLIGNYVFGTNRSMQSVFITYQAGYFETLPAQAVPASPFQITPSLLEGSWDSDLGVTNAAGVALTKVSGTPTTGQYSVSATGVYTFAGADVGTSVTVSCGVLPGPLNQACIELVALKYRERKRQGEKSATLGAQTISYFTTKDIKENVALYIDPFRRVGYSL